MSEKKINFIDGHKIPVEDRKNIIIEKLITKQLIEKILTVLQEKSCKYDEDGIEYNDDDIIDIIEEIDEELRRECNFEQKFRIEKNNL